MPTLTDHAIRRLAERWDVGILDASTIASIEEQIGQEIEAGRGVPSASGGSDILIVKLRPVLGNGRVLKLRPGQRSPRFVVMTDGTVLTARPPNSGEKGRAASE